MSNNSSRANNNTTHACAACKHQRRKCAPDCVLAPYFPQHRQRQFLNAHKLFGVRNITKTIENLHDPCLRDQVMRTIIFQSDARASDPVGGCYRIVCELKRQIEYSMVELELVLQQLALCRTPMAPHHAYESVSEILQPSQNQLAVSPAPADCHDVVKPCVDHAEMYGQMRQDIPHRQQRNVEGVGEDYFLNEASLQDVASWDRRSFGDERRDFKPTSTVDVGVLLVDTERIELESDEAISKDNKVTVKDEVAAFIENASLET